MKARKKRSSVGLLMEKKYLRIMIVLLLLAMFMCSEKEGALAVQSERISRSFKSDNRVTVANSALGK